MAVFQTLTRTSHPIASLYRGLTPNLVGNASSWAMFFYIKSRIEELLLDRKNHALSASQPKTDLTAWDNVMAATVGGFLTTVVTNPVFVLKTRMLSSDKGSEGAYPSMLSGARQLYQTEGLRGFYRGMGVSLLIVSHSAVQFGVYEPSKRMYVAREQRKQELLGITTPASEVKIGNEVTLVLSSFAKLVAGAVTYPYQVVRSRLQNYEAQERFGTGIRGVVKRLWREEGPRGFYRGVVPGVIRVMPATWVTFLVYENMKFYLPGWLDGVK